MRPSLAFPVSSHLFSGLSGNLYVNWTQILGDIPFNGAIYRFDVNQRRASIRLGPYALDFINDEHRVLQLEFENPSFSNEDVGLLRDEEIELIEISPTEARIHALHMDVCSFKAESVSAEWTGHDAEDYRAFWQALTDQYNDSRAYNTRLAVRIDESGQFIKRAIRSNLLKSEFRPEKAETYARQNQTLLQILRKLNGE